MTHQVEGGLPKIPLLLHEEGRRYGAGEVIVGVGSPSDCMYAVRQGEVEIRVGGASIEVLETGHVFGELGLIDDQPRSAEAVARTDCEVARIDRKRFEFLVQQTPRFALQIMGILAYRLRRGAPRV